MQPDAIRELFDQQAAGYDRQWEKTAPIRQCLHFLLESAFASLPAQARVLCVGVGTGVEMAHLARRFPGWEFTAVDPSAAMLEVSRQRAQEEGFIGRCRFHAGFLETLPDGPAHDAATCFLVSQFITDRDARAAFFGQIAQLVGGVQFQIRADQRGREHQLGGMQVHLGGLRALQRRVQRRPVLAPEIDLVAHARLQVRRPIPRAGQRLRLKSVSSHSVAADSARGTRPATKNSRSVVNGSRFSSR